MPFFSVLIPTRDRPKLLAFCLEALAAQTFDDFEVVVSDNAVDEPSRAIFERWERPGWRYLTPPGPLSMHDNWEFAAEAATGEFVGVVIDKTVLQPTALECAARALSAEPMVEIVTWGNDAYVPSDETADVGKGIVVTTQAVGTTAHYDPRAELEKMFSLDVRRGTDLTHYHRGKICFGVYGRPLVERIRQRAGRLFHPLSPDYTSRIPALALAREAVDLGRPLLLSYHSASSNGRQVASSPSYARLFLERTHPQALLELPIPGLYASQHNIVAYDYASSARRLPDCRMPTLDYRNLLRRAREDLDLVPWESSQERDAQYRILEHEEARCGIVTALIEPSPPEPAEPTRSRPRALVADALARVPPADRLVRAVLRKPLREVEHPAPVFASPVAAACAADRQYTADPLAH